MTEPTRRGVPAAADTFGRAGTAAGGVETLHLRREGGVLFAEIAAPPMNLPGPEPVRDLVSLIERAEADDATRVLVFKSANPDYFISHVDVTRIKEYREEAAKLTGVASPPSSPQRCGIRSNLFVSRFRANAARASCARRTFARSNLSGI